MSDQGGNNDHNARSQATEQAQLLQAVHRRHHAPPGAAPDSAGLLRELVEYGLRLALETPPTLASGQRTAFPLIKASADAPQLTDEQVQAALADMDEKDAQRHTGFVRH